MTVKNFIPAGTVRTAWNGVAVSNMGRMMKLFKCVKSTHTRMPPSFFGAMTIGWTHSGGTNIAGGKLCLVLTERASGGSPKVERRASSVLLLIILAVGGLVVRAW